MKKHLFLAVVLACTTLSGRQSAAQTVDAGFRPSTLYAPAAANWAAQQADGKIVAVGNFTRVNGTGTSHVARFLPNGTLDALFQQNIAGLTGTPDQVLALPNGQVLLQTRNAVFTAGTITRPGLMRLNADGTPDASFDVGSGPTYSNISGHTGSVLPLANGKYLVQGGFSHFNGLPAFDLVRLNANGSADNSFTATFTNGGQYNTLCELPNGQYLVGGFMLNSPSINNTYSLARLNGDGSIDTSFQPALDPGDYVEDVKVQANGKILVSGGISDPNSPNGPSFFNVVRLMPNGQFDPSFTKVLNNRFAATNYGGQLALLATGKILLLVNATSGGVVRLNDDGSTDTTFRPASTGNQSLVPACITPLLGDKVLVAGGFTTLNGALDQALVQLNSDGTLDASFAPTLQINGTANVVRLQPDGKLLLGGNFSEVNGQPFRRLARLNADGTVDAGFIAAHHLNYSVVDVALQPDGRILALTGHEISRMHAFGSVDISFLPPTYPAATTFTKFALQPDGRVLIGAVDRINPNPLFRLLPDGSADTSFNLINPAGGSFQQVNVLALQPDGKILAGGIFRPTGPGIYNAVARLEPNGRFDNTFTLGRYFYVTGSSSVYPAFNSLIIQPDGKVLVGGGFVIAGTSAGTGIARLSANGLLETSFYSQPNRFSYAIALQPNSLILFAETDTYNGPFYFKRLLSDGNPDGSFTTTAVPDGPVRSMLVQPDGKIVVAGSFTAVGGQPYMGVARLTAPNVLAVPAPAALAARLDAWPVPAHEQLTVQTEATAHALALDLLDMLGRPVRHLPLLPGASRASLPCVGLPAGPYLLRVTYTEGVVARRVQLQ